MNTTTEKTIVAFHIGRGGRFYNAGHKSFVGEHRIGHFTDDLFIDFENASDLTRKLDGKENLNDLLQEARQDNHDAISRFENWNFKLGEKIYTDCNGNHVGLTVAEEETGIGRINIDNEYDTTYTCLLENCDEKELQLVLDNEYAATNDVIAYCNEKLTVEESN